ncbi:MAG: ATP-binding cassette, subfamily B [Verrucomicrobia bacterium]|nr:MAG: ATP-binding cassette, subfamily B [Verrucomicrobiota bacterium]
MARSSSAHFDNAPKAKLSKELLRRNLWIFGYLSRYRRMFVPAMIAVLATSGMSMAFPVLMGQLIGESMSDDAVAQRANQIALTLLGILSLQSCITFVRMQLLGRAGDRAVAEIRRDAYGHLIRLPMAFFSERRVGEVSSRLASDLSMIRDTLCSTTPQFLRQCVLLSAGLVYLFILSAKLALVLLACLPAVLLFIAAFGFRIRGTSREAQDLLAASNVIVDETLHGIAGVKAFSNEAYEAERYGGAIQKYLDVAFKLVNGRAVLVAFIIFALMGAITLVVWFGARLLVSGEISRPDFTQFAFVAAFVAGAFGALPELVTEIQKAVGATDRLREILDETVEGDLADGKSPTGPAAGDVEFRGVRFAYPSRPDIKVLDGVDFKIRSGQRVALVGPSGAGKSTVISLLLRFFDPQDGQILIDGAETGKVPLEWLRRQMALVPQEVLLFGGSIRENILYGRPGATETEVRDAARRANAAEFIEGFPETYDTVVGERGIKLSGGQRQRIAIARAILADPALLLLDEATSSLDSESERLVQEALDELMRGRTSLIVAHRLSTVRDADLILVLNEGRIVQTGTHEALLQEQDGLYRMLAQLQLT